MTYTLTKADVTAMRKADTVVFRHKDGATAIECAKRLRQGNDPFADTERRHVFVIPGRAQYGGFDRYHGEDNAKAFTAFDMIHSAQFSDEWQTAAAVFKAGDELTAQWFASAGNGYCKYAVCGDDKEGSGPWHGLHHDWLCLVAQRKAGKSWRKLTFRVCDSVCPDNSARMIKAVEYRLNVA